MRVGGVGLPEIKANPAQFQVKLPTGAELSNNYVLYLLSFSSNPMKPNVKKLCDSV